MKNKRFAEMMALKPILLTQQMSKNEYGEITDSLNTSWYRFMRYCGLLPVLVPNCQYASAEMIDGLGERFSGAILTGGNTLENYGGDAIMRDNIEKSILENIEQLKLPLIGVCRGMQLINEYYGGCLEPVEDQVTKEMDIIFKDGATENLNSYHDWGIKKLGNELKKVAWNSGGQIKAIEHVSNPIHGIMWHPERMQPFANRDIEFFKAVFA